uniref:40S ribosomal protein S3a n=1 Tax=Lactuca sativa TaxID=4236 RepID=A0A9R1UWX1_LACSA|nr:hypothetical protein LSAT_V11C700351170 [Lactuca sativa]
MMGMDFTTDKLRSLVRKWQSLIEAHVNVKTTNSYTLRMLCIWFINKRIRGIMITQAQFYNLKELVLKFIPESIGNEIEKATSSIYPLQNVFIRRVKILKAPKFDLGKLMEVHRDYSEDVSKVERWADEPIVEATKVIGA